MYIKLNLFPLMAKSNIKSISELSRLTGISRPTLYRQANGQAKVIENKTLAKLCSVLKCDIKDIMILESEVK